MRKPLSPFRKEQGRGATFLGGSDSLYYTEERALAACDTLPQRALLILDSAVIIG